MDKMLIFLNSSLGIEHTYFSKFFLLVKVPLKILFFIWRKVTLLYFSIMSFTSLNLLILRLISS